MSLKQVKSALRSLPYTEMRALGQQIFDRLLWGTPSTEQVCELLASLPAEANEEIENEAVFLARAFTKPKKGKFVIELRTDASGAWEAKAGDFVQVASTVRGAISELLDQIAAYEALWGKKS